MLASGLFIKFFATEPLLLSVAVLGAVLIFTTNDSSYFDKEDVIETCQDLDFSLDSKFCTESDVQTPQSLETALNEKYPINSTTISQLSNSISTKLNYATESCNNLRSLPNDSYPDSRECKDGFMYYANLPMFSARLWITFDEELNVVNYSVAYDSNS